LRLGAVYCNKRRVRADRPLRKGEYLRVHIEPKRYPLPKLDWRSLIVAATPEFLVVNKPPGVPMHAMLDNEVENLLYQLRQSGYPELWVTQRLDNDTEGLCVLARTKTFQAEFNERLRNRDLEKHYRAWVEGTPSLGPWIHYMKPTPWAPKELASEPSTGWARCELIVETAAVLPQNPAWREVEVRLVTGRTHQIRAQLSHEGHPVVGDSLYGKADGGPLRLQSAKLAFHFRGKRLEFTLARPTAWDQP
ncbi:MAG: RNA pseudouridine synthase, partial [Bdellovibrionales bacterium]|nr:RNA pseudouridine synthase [Bdellovibrionales bacterium]